MAFIACEILSQAYSEWLALVLMIVAGIPHGAFDLRVARAKWRERHELLRWIVVGYLACVFAMSGLCVFLPTIGFTIFMGISALHFIEGEALAGESPDYLRGSIFGLGSIVLPIGFHPEVARIYMSCFVSPALFDSIVTPLWIVTLILSIAIGITLCFDLVATRPAGVQSTTTLERLLCASGWILLSPLAGFAIWFIGRHSRQHLEVCGDKFLTTGFKIPLDFLGISLLAIAGLSPFALLFDFSRIDQLFAASLALIAGLTLPHMIVSHGIREI